MSSYLPIYVNKDPSEATYKLMINSTKRNMIVIDFENSNDVVDSIHKFMIRYKIWSETDVLTVTDKAMKNPKSEKFHDITCFLVFYHISVNAHNEGLRQREMQQKALAQQRKLELAQQQHAKAQQLQREKLLREQEAAMQPQSHLHIEPKSTPKHKTPLPSPSPPAPRPEKKTIVVKKLTNPNMPVSKESTKPSPKHKEPAVAKGDDLIRELSDDIDNIMSDLLDTTNKKKLKNIKQQANKKISVESTASMSPYDEKDIVNSADSTSSEEIASDAGSGSETEESGTDDAIFDNSDGEVEIGSSLESSESEEGEVSLSIEEDSDKSDSLSELDSDKSDSSNLEDSDKSESSSKVESDNSSEDSSDQEEDSDQEDDIDACSTIEESEEASPSPPPPVKRGRGRPPTKAAPVKASKPPPVKASKSAAPVKASKAVAKPPPVKASKTAAKPGPKPKAPVARKPRGKK